MTINKLPYFSCNPIIPAARRALGISRLSLTPQQDAAIARRWHYDSDHLRIRCVIMGLQVGSWNVLNPAYAHHLNRPGWRESPLIQSETEKQGNTSISIRTIRCAEKIKETLFGTEGCDVLCLQECSNQLIELLYKKFSLGSVFIFHQPNGGLYQGDKSIDNHLVTLVKNTSLVSVNSVAYPVLFRRYYSSSKNGPEELGWDRWRCGIDTALTLPKGAMRIFNVHLSTAGQSTARKLARVQETFEQVERLTHPHENIAIIGDTNLASDWRNRALTPQWFCLSSGQPSQVDNKVLFAEDIDAALFRPTHSSHMNYVGKNNFLKSDPQTAEVYARTLHRTIALTPDPAHP